MKNLIDVTHANLKTDVSIMRSAIFAIYASKANQATHVVSIGGSFLPVLESKEQVVALLNQEEVIKPAKPIKLSKEKKKNVSKPIT